MAAILASGRYSDDGLVRLAAEHDPGSDLAWFTEALEAADRIPDTGFAEYGLNPAAASALYEGVVTKLFERLRDSTWVYPGHGSDTTLGAERPHLEEWRERGW